MDNRHNRQTLASGWPLFLFLHALMLVPFITTRIFVNTFIFKLSGGMNDVGYYSLLMCTGLIVCFLVTGSLCKLFGCKFLFCLSFLITSGFFVLLYFLRENLVSYIVPIALLHGLAAGLYWLPFHQYMLDLSLPGKRGLLVSRVYMVVQVTSLIIPAFYGWVITETESYGPVVLITSVIALGGFLLATFKFKENNDHRGAYGVRDIIKLVSQEKDLRNVLIAMTLIGFSFWGALDIITPILIYQATGNELSLGIIASTLPAIEFSSSWLNGHISLKHHSWALLCYAIFFLAVACLVTIFMVKETVFAYAFVISFTGPAISIIVQVFGYNIIHKYAAIQKHQIEYTQVREVFLFVGRVFSYGTLIVLSTFYTTSLVLRLMLIVCALGVLGLALFLRRVNVHS